jgi:hypothetical protein
MIAEITNVLSPADSFGLVTLEELKSSLKIGIGDISEDDFLQLIIETGSGDIAAELNRTLAYERVKDIFIIDASAGSRRLYLSHWPARLAAVETLTYAARVGGSERSILTDTNWILEEDTGIITLIDGTVWDGTITATYGGGYDLPEETPDGLKQAMILIGRDAWFASIRGDSSIRSISHKGARVMYFSPQQMLAGAKGQPGSYNTIDRLLRHYRRQYV